MSDTILCRDREDAKSVIDDLGCENIKDWEPLEDGTVRMYLYGTIGKIKEQTNEYKPISWFGLWKRLGKQPLNKTRGQYVKCLIEEQMWYCQLVYNNNGSDFYLLPVKEQKNDN